MQLLVCRIQYKCLPHVVWLFVSVIYITVVSILENDCHHKVRLFSPIHACLPVSVQAFALYIVTVLQLWLFPSYSIIVWLEFRPASQWTFILRPEWKEMWYFCWLVKCMMRSVCFSADAAKPDGGSPQASRRSGSKDKLKVGFAVQCNFLPASNFVCVFFFVPHSYSAMS